MLLTPDYTRFRIWAPNAESAAVHLELESCPAIPMRPLDGGWFEVTAKARTGDRYRFRLANGLTVPDPASRRQVTDVHSASVVLDSNSYEWRNSDWAGRPWHEAVLYELHVGLLGGFNAILAYLPHLQDLGVTAIELTPIADFPGRRNWGYDGVLPYAVDTSYGTPDELKALIDTAHGLGIMMFLDVVYNHFGPEGAYLHTYAKDFFDSSTQTPWGSAINFQRPEVRSFFEENAIFWLSEYRFDGLRFDAVHAISDKDWIHGLGERLRQEFCGRHIHLVLENEHNTATALSPDGPFDAQWNDDGHNALHCLVTRESDGYYVDFAERTAEKLACVLQDGFLYQGQVVPRTGVRRGEPSAQLPPTSFVLFLQNHDQIGNRAFGERLSDLVSPAAMIAATALLLLCPQIPMIFMGEEWSATARFLFFTDYHHGLAEAVREGRRREFSQFPAFQDPTVLARTPDPNDPATFAASVPDFNEVNFPRHAAMLATHKHLLALRQAEIIPRLQATRSMGAHAIGTSMILARWRMGDGAVLTIVTNFSEAELQCPTPVTGTCLFEAMPGAFDALVEFGTLAGPCTVVVIERPNRTAKLPGPNVPG